MPHDLSYHNMISLISNFWILLFQLFLSMFKPANSNASPNRSNGLDGINDTLVGEFISFQHPPQPLVQHLLFWEPLLWNRKLALYIRLEKESTVCNMIKNIEKKDFENYGIYLIDVYGSTLRSGVHTFQAHYNYQAFGHPVTRLLHNKNSNL